MGLINSKNQVSSACYVAADFNWSHPFEYQVIVAQLSIFFFHADDILEHKPEVLRQLQRNVATGQPTGDPVLDWFVRELTPKLWRYFDPLVANMIVVACYDAANGIGIELLTEHAELNRDAPGFPDWLRFKTGLSPMYSLLALARASDPQLPTGTGGLEKHVQTIPDVIIFTNIVNDVISWYKEHLAGEQKNYIAMRAHKDGVDVVAALRTVADEGIRVYNRALAALADEPEYRANFDAYAKGHHSLPYVVPAVPHGRVVWVACGRLDEGSRDSRRSFRLW
jgi:hypothetical protein